MNISLDKKYRTRDGHEVTLLHRAPEGWLTKYPWRGLLDGEPNSWDEEGRFEVGRDGKFDLIEVRDPRTFKAVVIRKCGTLAAYEKGDEKNDDYEVVTVREVMEDAP